MWSPIEKKNWTFRFFFCELEIEIDYYSRNNDGEISEIFWDHEKVRTETRFRPCRMTDYSACLLSLTISQFLILCWNWGMKKIIFMNLLWKCDLHCLWSSSHPDSLIQSSIKNEREVVTRASCILILCSFFRVTLILSTSRTT